jgi:hypothetical protein
VSDAGAEDEDVDEALDELLELQPAMARAAAAPNATIAAGVLRSLTAGSPSGWAWNLETRGANLRRKLVEKFPNR